MAPLLATLYIFALPSRKQFGIQEKAVFYIKIQHISPDGFRFDEKRDFVCAISCKLCLVGIQRGNDVYGMFNKMLFHFIKKMGDLMHLTL